MSQSRQISYLIMVALLVVAGWFHLSTLLLTALFGFFALNLLFRLGQRKIVAIALYFTVVITIAYGLFHFTKRVYVELPKIIDATVPAIVEYAERQNVELPFTDYASLKTLVLTEAKEKIVNVGRYTRHVAVELASIIIGLVVAASIFLNGGFTLEGDPHARRGGLYSQVVQELARRFQLLYQSFTIVIGAQIFISAINTALTSIFLLSAGFPYVTVILVLTFLCGLLPIIGNIVSNTLIVGVGFTLSPNMALLALVFLVVIHKLEYFLNSKIIGHRIKNPMWLTLIGLVIGENVMGIPGMILAPVILHYIKVEASEYKVTADPTPLPSPGNSP